MALVLCIVGTVLQSNGSRKVRSALFARHAESLLRSGNQQGQYVAYPADAVVVGTPVIAIAYAS